MGALDKQVIPRTGDEAGYGNPGQASDTPRREAGGVCEVPLGMRYPGRETKRGMGTPDKQVIPRAGDEAGYGRPGQASDTPDGRRSGVWEPRTSK